MATIPKAFPQQGFSTLPTRFTPLKTPKKHQTETLCPMKTAENKGKSPHLPLNRSLRFWAVHTGISAPTLSRWLRTNEIKPSRKRGEEGYTLNQVLTAISYH
jgi:hypothetical protein